MMLSETTDTLEVVTSAAADIECVIEYFDATKAAPPVVQGDTSGRSAPADITTATTTTVLSAPAASEMRKVEFATFRNNHASVSCDVTVQLNANGTIKTRHKVTLLAGEMLQYENGLGFFTHEAGKSAATQTDQEAGTSTTKFVAPATQQFHLSAVKCHGFTTGGGTPVLHANSYNTTSITDTATGRLTVTIATDFSSANWIGICTPGCATNANRMAATVSKAAGSVILEASSATTTLADPGTGWDWAFLGDQ